MKNPILFPVTYDCNLRCSYCSLPKIPVDTDKGIELILSGDNDEVWITGGEPLLLPNIVDICQRLRAGGKKVGLTTNGTIHKFEVLDHIDKLGVSIDGDENTTDYNRGRGTFAKALKYLEEAIKHPIETVIMATTVKHDKEQEDFLERLGDKLGVTYLQVTVC